MLLFLCLFAAGPLVADAPSPVTALLFAPDGETLVAASQQGLAIYSWPNLERHGNQNMAWIRLCATYDVLLFWINQHNDRNVLGMFLGTKRVERFECKIPKVRGT